MRKPPPPPTIPQSGQAKRGEAGHLGYLLRQASLAWRARMEHALAEFAVTPPQFAALTMIGAYPDLSSADLARASLLTPATVATIVANLKRAAMITARPHPVHGRILQLALTAKGKALLERCKRHVYALEADLTIDMSEADENAVRRWLARVATAG
ncbi:MAG: MarR family winged helix-turn-helix transcriptional regulator [Roseiarcus sp.]|jgi:DNA-binding MarR family transcriptional regulator